MCHFGLNFLVMSSSSESILDHLKFISGAQSFWYTLNTSFNHDCHLVSQFRLEPNNYEVLLVVAGLTSYTRFGFAIKPMAWIKFLGGHQFAVDGQVRTKKIDIDAIINVTTPSCSNRGKLYIV